MKVKQLATQERLTAEDYKESLPKHKFGQKGVIWTMERFSTYVNLLYPHVTVVPGQEWTGNGTKYKFICEIHGPYETKANHLPDETRGCQCIGCKSDKDTASAGTRRSHRATKEEKILATKLHSEGMSYSAIGRQLGRAQSTITKWLDPEYRERVRQSTAKWRTENREQNRANSRRYNKFEHGKAGRKANEATRRLQKQNIPELVFIDNEWHEVDRKKTYKVFKDYLLPPAEKKAIQELYMEAQHQTETTGIDHHVDHIWPLSVGGEHRMFNLQILPATENQSKSNTFREEDQALIIQRLFN